MKINFQGEPLSVWEHSTPTFFKAEERMWGVHWQLAEILYCLPLWCTFVLSRITSVMLVSSTLNRQTLFLSFCTWPEPHQCLLPQSPSASSLRQAAFCTSVVHVLWDLKASYVCSWLIAPLEYSQEIKKKKKNKALSTVLEKYVSEGPVGCAHYSSQSKLRNPEPVMCSSCSPASHVSC